MPSLCRVGDNNSGGGQLLTGALTVICNGLQVATHPSQITPHQPFAPPPAHVPHAQAVTTMGSATVFCEGLPVVYVGAGNSCGMHTMIGGSLDVDVGI